jgi:hypothetical protein
LLGWCVRVARAARFARQQHNVFLDNRLAGCALRRGGLEPFFLAGFSNLTAIESGLRRFDYFLMLFFLTVFAIFLRFPFVLLFLGFLFALFGLVMLGFFRKLFLGQVIFGVMRFFVAFLVEGLMKVAVPPITFVVEYWAAHV